MATDIPKIGTHLNVFTARRIRYQGRLASVNRQTQSITLENVRTFGTEDRVQDREQIVRPRAEIFDSVEFNANNIVDIKLAYRGIEDDPAVMNQPVIHRNAYPNQNNRGDYNNYRQHLPGRANNRQGRFDRNYSGNFQPRFDKPVRGRNGQFVMTAAPRVDPELEKEFDFEKAHEAFINQNEAKKAEDEQPKPSESDKDDQGVTEITLPKEEAVYTKDAFFDNLSSSTGVQWDRNNERAKNVETFNLKNSVFVPRRYGYRNQDYHQPRQHYNNHYYGNFRYNQADF